MLKVGISGVIGSGKSTVCSIFQLLGTPVYNADHEAKMLYQKEDVKQLVEENFGTEIFDPSGNIVFSKLADIVFNNRQQLQRINQIIHPLVKEDFRDWCGQYAKHPYVLYESALFYESGFYKDYERSIVVLAPQDLCIKRIVARDHVSEDQVRARLQSQWPPEKKAKLADFLIHNDEKQMLIPQVLEVHRMLVNGEQ